SPKTGKKPSCTKSARPATTSAAFFRPGVTACAWRPAVACATTWFCTVWMGPSAMRPKLRRDHADVEVPRPLVEVVPVDADVVRPGGKGLVDEAPRPRKRVVAAVRDLGARARRTRAEGEDGRVRRAIHVQAHALGLS